MRLNTTSLISLFGVVSPILCPIHEDAPGPSAPNPDALSAEQLRFRAVGDPAEPASGKLTMGRIRDELAHVVEQRSARDPNLHYLDGRDLYGQAEFDALPLADQLHPDAATHHHIAKRFARLAFGPAGFFNLRRLSGRSTGFGGDGTSCDEIAGRLKLHP